VFGWAVGFEKIVVSCGFRKAVACGLLKKLKVVGCIAVAYKESNCWWVHVSADPTCQYLSQLSFSSCSCPSSVGREGATSLRERRLREGGKCRRIWRWRPRQRWWSRTRWRSKEFTCRSKEETGSPHETNDEWGRRVRQRGRAHGGRRKGRGAAGTGAEAEEGGTRGQQQLPPPSVPHSKFYLADFSKQERLKLRC
jgi:hypothetical protein